MECRLKEEEEGQDEHFDMENENDLQKTVLNAEFSRKRDNPNETTLLMNSKQIMDDHSIDRITPMLDYDSMLDDPLFRTVWRIRNKNILHPTKFKSKRGGKKAHKK